LSAWRGEPNYLNLSDYLAIAAAVTDLDLQTLTDSSRLDLADSALHAPEASFGGEEFYPDFVDKPSSSSDWSKTTL
jgi:death-on-curing protein